MGVSRQGFYQYLTNRERPWKYQALADAMLEIVTEDACNDTYGRTRMRQALELKAPEGIAIPSERTVYRVMERLGLSHCPKRKPNGITKEDREAMKSDDLLKRDFSAEKPLENASQISQRSRQRTENCMYPPSLTALMSLSLAWLWRRICARGCASGHWKMLQLLILI